MLVGAVAATNNFKCPKKESREEENKKKRQKKNQKKLAGMGIDQQRPRRKSNNKQRREKIKGTHRHTSTHIQRQKERFLEREGEECAGPRKTILGSCGYARAPPLQHGVPLASISRSEAGKYLRSMRRQQRGKRPTRANRATWGPRCQGV